MEAAGKRIEQPLPILRGFEESKTHPDKFSASVGSLKAHICRVTVVEFFSFPNLFAFRRPPPACTGEGLHMASTEFPEESRRSSHSSIDLYSTSAKAIL